MTGAVPGPGGLPAVTGAVRGDPIGSPTVVTAARDGQQSTVGGRWVSLGNRWKRPVLIGCAAALVLRVVVEVVALVAVYGVRFPHVVAGDPHVLVTVLAKWDAGFFVGIAQHGYPVSHGPAPAVAAFAPLCPAAIGAVHTVTGLGLLLAGQVVSWLALAAGLAGLVHLVELDRDEAHSASAVTLLVAFPTAFFLVVDYADSLALALVVLAFVAARHQRWAVAGLAASGAFLTKFYLAIVVVGLLVELWTSSRPAGPAERRVALRRALLVTVPTVAALVGWMVVNAWRFHDALAFVHAQSHWNRHAAFPWTLAWTTAGDLVHLRFLDTSTASVMELFDALTVVLLVVAAVVAWRRVRPSYGVLLALAVCLFTFQSVLYSETREVLALFPFFVVGADVVTGHRWRERVVLAFVVPIAYFLCTRFVTGSFAG